MSVQEQAESNLKLLSTLSFLSGFRAFDGVIAIYFAAVSGSYTIAMTALAVMNLSASFFEIPTGIFSDRIGRRWTLILFYLASLISVIVLYFAQSAGWLFVAVVLNGFAIAMRSGTTSAYVYENLEILGKVAEFKKQEGSRQALIKYATAAAGVAGAAVIYFFDIRAAILLTSLVLLVAFVLSLRLYEIRNEHPNTSNIYAGLGNAWRKFKDDIALRNISIAQMLAIGGENVEYRLRSLFFAIIAPTWVVSLLIMLNHLFSAVSMNHTHRLVDKIGSKYSLLTVGLLDRIGTTVFVIINTLSSAFAMSILTSLCFGVRKIAAEDLLQSRYSKDERATMGSIVGLGGSLVYGVAGIVVGALADAIGVFNTMLAIQPFLLLSVLFFYLGTRRADTDKHHKLMIGK
jgi:MFS family permease